MADIDGVDPIGNKELRLKRENAEQPVDGAPHHWKPAFSPGPYLGCDQVDHGNMQLFQAERQAKMKIRTVGQNSDVGMLVDRRSQQLSKLAPDSRNVSDYLHQPNDGDAGSVHYGVNARSLH